MKKRINFVSNSSSSSYVVIPEEINACHINNAYNKIAQCFMFCVDSSDWDGLLDGEIKFDWQWKKYFDFESKWNWLVLQAYYGGQSYMNKIDSYLKLINSKVHLNWNKIEYAVQDNDIYIDHQSIDAEETFKKVENIGIGEFLLNEKCYIQNGNDNEEPEEGEI